MVVKQIMNRDIIYISPDTSVKEIFKIMINLDTPFLPVLDDDRKILGYVLLRNLLERMKLYRHKKIKEDTKVHLDHTEFIKEQKKLYGKTARDIMGTDIIALDENTNVVDAVEFMLKKNMFRLPIVRKDTIVGCVTAHDVLGALYRLEEGKKMEDMPLTDEELKYMVYSAIKRNLDVRVSKLNVQAKAGEVHLYGSVATLSDYKAVEDIVNSLPDIKSVSNSMIVDQMLK